MFNPVNKALPTPKRVQTLDCKEFAVAAVLDPDEKAFVVYVASLTSKKSIPIIPARKAQVALFYIEYSNFVNDLSLGSATELTEHTAMDLRVSSHLMVRPLA